MKQEFEVCMPRESGTDYWELMIGAYDAEDAAKQCAKDWNENSGEYSLVNRSTYVLVRKPGETKHQFFYVSAESYVNYSSTEVEKIRCQHCKKDCSSIIEDGRELYDYSYCSRECFQEWLKEYHRKLNE